MVAAHAGQHDVVTLLVEHGATLDVTAKFGLSALMLAVVAGHPEVVRLLAHAGADRSLRGTGAPGFAGKTARDLALARGLDDLAAELVDPETVLAFWLGTGAGDPTAAKARGSFWFGASAETDALVRTQFTTAVEAAEAGVLDAWLGQPPSALALVLLLDQFPRNIYRGTAAAFTHDPRARATARHAVGAGYLEALSPLESSFLILPYEHSESLDDQRESVRLSELLFAKAPAPWRPVLGEYLAFATQHLAIIERFGRFPHRNATLGRPSTADEQQYLASGGATFGQSPD
jgi:uncharacterized protein (DUF924 family)